MAGQARTLSLSLSLHLELVMTGISYQTPPPPPPTHHSQTGVTAWSDHIRCAEVLMRLVWWQPGVSTRCVALE